MSGCRFSPLMFSLVGLGLLLVEVITMYFQLWFHPALTIPCAVSNTTCAVLAVLNLMCLILFQMWFRGLNNFVLELFWQNVGLYGFRTNVIWFRNIVSVAFSKLKTLGDLHMDPESAKEQAMKQGFNMKWSKLTSEHLDKHKDVNIDAAFFHEETDNTATTVFKNFKDIVKDLGPKIALEVSNLASKPVKMVDFPTHEKKPSVFPFFRSLPSHAQEVDKDNGTDTDTDTDSAGEFEVPSQAELIKDAFAGDDVVAEFEKNKQEVLNEENREPEEPKLVPGWGDWTQTQKRRGLPPWMVKEHEDAKKKREEFL
ncbi:hypothetical protein QQ045_028664 [Rhodiola kirilowii]